MVLKGYDILGENQQFPTPTDDYKIGTDYQKYVRP
jgi:hypothetical protein